MKRKYIYADRQILAQHDIDEGEEEDFKYFYLHDRLGSVRLVIDDQSAVKNTYTYEPFGEMFATECTETTENPFKFTGQYFDSEIEEYYLRARQYNPQIARFTSRDPVRGKFKEPLTLHKYLYSNNDPINMIDPTGKFLSGAMLAKPIMAGYSVHYGAIGFAAYGVATGNERFLTLGINMEYMIAPVMAIVTAMAKIEKYLERVLDDHYKRMGDNATGEFNPGNLGGPVLIATALVVLAWELDGCSPDPLEELPSRQEWQELMKRGDEQRFERPPGDPG